MFMWRCEKELLPFAQARPGKVKETKQRGKKNNYYTQSDGSVD